MKEKECDFCRVCVGICRKTVGMAAINITKQANGDQLIEFLAEKCIACGMDSYIEKPVTTELLKKTVRHWLSEVL